MTKALAGQSAIVAAGAKNLGGLVSVGLAQRGANVLVHYNSASTEPDADKTVAAVEDAGVRAVKFQADLTVPANVERMFDTALTAFGSVDVAVNTVGKVLRKPITETTEAEYDSMFDINAKAAYFFLKEAGRRLADNGRVVTVLTALLAAFTDGYSTYAGAKSPVEHFTRAAAKEFASRGISVNNVAPGPMDTPFFYGQETPERVEFHKSQALGGRLTDITDIAPLIEFLVTDGKWITGQTIFANGGYTTR
ncbi:SDR family oxidoreductase [Nocardia puris]|uniref:NAD(P)-dependent dehydrogenase (Short-subunit alcohol dehydrogenase family) n=1 Tax=Nocardia puris TaxID=208602 RepID=A0A366DJH9_9NOCA|nr:SDR family oxidoreductase [Nocardia puris]MBF6213299.1 SDR family oxidoreductase [Nocardia puris]MBF6369891.1 SDR family oxidoreductase [Nocardia puris]MBF6462178.1 SDR family oxidoreductase [Nocardia puris]RBO89484.1 NAD(P)-dependent dehydrogenase (short-subunit alcohol dehydrogenase family) [Nocardia puris]